MIFSGVLTPRSLSLASILLTSSFAPSYAQEDLGEFLGQIVVTANRGERPISAIPGSVQVIEEDAISDQLAQGNDATNLLARLVPGFSFGNQTLSGASETFRGRGVLIMVDGVPRNTPLRDASRSLSLIDLNAIERVEVIGGASSLYGAGGTGGVVNFITKKGDLADGKAKVTVDLKARGFTSDLGDSIAPAASIGIAQKLGAFDYDVTLSGDRTRATYDGEGALLPSDPMLGQGGGDYTTKANLGLRMGYDLDDAKRLELSFERVDLEQNPKYFTNYNVSPVAPDLTKPYYGLPIAEDSNYLNLRYTDSAFALGKLSISYARNDVDKRFAFNIFDPQVNTLVYYSGNPADPTADYNQTELSSLRNTLTVGVDSPISLFGREAALSWGFEFGSDKTRQNAINGQAVATPLDSRSKAIFAQLTLPVSDSFTLSGGLRYDRYDLTVGSFTRPRAYYYFPAYGLGLDLAPVAVSGGDFDFDQTTGNLGFTWDLSESRQLFGGWSQGYSLTDIGSFTRRAGMNSLAEICTAYGNDNPMIAAAYGCSAPGTYALSYADIGPKPQLVDTWEIGLRDSGANWSGQVSAFYSTSDDGVNFNPVTNQVSQQREEIWGVEAQGLYTLSRGTVFDAMIAFREGRVDKAGDGTVDAWIGNNRIGAPLRMRLGVAHQFENGWSGRVEGIHMASRDKAPGEISLSSVNLVNATLSKELGNGVFSVAVENLFDHSYANPTATATRNVESMGWGRTVTLGYRMAF